MPKIEVPKKKKKEKNKGQVKTTTNGDNKVEHKKKEVGSAPKAQVPYIPQPPKEATDSSQTKKPRNDVTGVKRKQESNGRSDKRPNKKQKK